jgi:serine/threonine protein kinase
MGNLESLTFEKEMESYQKRCKTWWNFDPKRVAMEDREEVTKVIPEYRGLEEDVVTSTARTETIKNEEQHERRQPALVIERVSDLVRDSELDTHINHEYTVHVYSEPDPDSRRRAVLREEYWRRQSLIGGGSYRRVWLEKCEKGQRKIEVRAVKEIVTGKTGHCKPTNYNRELEAIAKFSHWKYERCFVKSYGWYKTSEMLFITMEYLEFGDLEDYLSKAPQLPEPEAKEITFQILEGLHFMHKNEFAHRDLKPAVRFF